MGANVLLMPYSLCIKLNLDDIAPTTISLRLADRSYRIPRGVIEDVPVNVGNVYISANFVVLKMKRDNDTLIILGRPFLAKTDVVISVKKSLIKFNVVGEKVIFNFPKICKGPTLYSDYDLMNCAYFYEVCSLSAFSLITQRQVV